MAQPSVIQVQVSAPARLHMGLLDCGNSTGRLFGGAGLAVDGLDTTITCRRSKDWKVTFASETETALSERARSDLNNLITTLSKSLGPKELTVNSTTPEHKGLGSKTSLLMAASAAAHFVEGITDRQRITAATGRGGTSGIGINTFWEGGLVVDSGHRENRIREFAPSSVRHVTDKPFVLNHVYPPSDWTVQLFFDPSFSVIDGDRERQIFQQAMPIDDIENLRCIAAIHTGVIPAFIAQDIDELREALIVLNTNGMKAVEVAHQTSLTQEFIRLGWQKSFAIGLSSFGPIVYEIGNTSSASRRKLVAHAQEVGMKYMGEYPFDSTGASINSTYSD